ncbi:MAG TPA: beta-galactosidase [Polyangia bacterium]|nr:beta-galactosidase [Polyangia bacterium]
MPVEGRRAPGLGAAVLSLLVAGCPAAPARVSAPAAARGARAALRVVPIGLCEDYPEESRTLAAARADLDVLAAAGVRTLRVGIGWDDVEPEPGRFEWAFWDAFVDLVVRERGVRLIPYVAYTPRWAARRPEGDFWTSPPRQPAAFGEVVGRLAARYRGRVESWELWNEPDNREYWSGSPAELAALVEAGARSARAASPGVTIVLGGLAAHPRFLDEVFAAGAGWAFDVVNVHAYFETWSPEPLERIPGLLAEVSEIVRRNGGRQPLWMAEVGYGDHRDGARVSAGVRATFTYEHTPAFQAVALVRTLAEILSSPEVSLTAWYRVRDLTAKTAVIGDDNNRHLGVVRADGAPKPALAALGLMTSLFGAGFAPARAEVRPREGSGPVVARAFRLADGRAVVIAWIPTHPPGVEPNGASLPAPDPRAAAVDVALALGTAGDGTRLDVTGERPGAPIAARHQPGGTVLPLDLRAGAVAVVVLAAAAISATP